MGNIVLDSQQQSEKALNHGARNLLASVSNTENTTQAHYIYNAKGQSVAKIVNGETTHFHYDIYDRLLGETQLSKGEQQTSGSEYLYAADQRLAVVNFSKQSQNLQFMVNYHLGTPQQLLSANGQVVWQRNATPFWGACGERSGPTAAIAVPRTVF